MEQSKEHILTLQEQETLIATAKGRNKHIITILLFTGMRAGELANSQYTWIDWQEEVIRIPKEQGTWKPKTKAGNRTIPIAEPRLKEALRHLYYTHPEFPMTRQAIHALVRKTAKTAGIPHKVYPHSLRATYATRLASLNVSAAALQHIMGWAQLSTAEHYIRLSGMNAKNEVMQKWK